MKLNSLADAQVIDELYAASARGTHIDLIVRGICCLRAGVPGLSANIRVRSILGRYLEHSRIFRFAHGSETDEVLHLIGSADVMGRNLDRRIEVLTPLQSERHQRWLDHTIEVLLADGAPCFELSPEGNWERIGPGTFEPHPQRLLYEWAANEQTRRSRFSPEIPTSTV